MQALATYSENEISFMLKLTLLINHSFLINYNIANIGNNASAMLLDFMEKIVDIPSLSKEGVQMDNECEEFVKNSFKNCIKTRAGVPCF